jgi:hypothetical protein
MSQEPSAPGSQVHRLDPQLASFPQTGGREDAGHIPSGLTGQLKQALAEGRLSAVFLSGDKNQHITLQTWNRERVSRLSSGVNVSRVDRSNGLLNRPGSGIS